MFFIAIIIPQPCLLQGRLCYKITSYKASLPQRGLKRHQLSAEHSENRPIVMHTVAGLEIVLIDP